MVFSRRSTVLVTFQTPPNYHSFLKSWWKTALIFKRNQLMDSIYFLGAREQPRERQTRWIPLSTLPGTTSDTPTLTTRTGREGGPCPAPRVRVRLGLPRTTCRCGIGYARGLRGKCPFRVKGGGAGVDREHPRTMVQSDTGDGAREGRGPGRKSLRPLWGSEKVSTRPTGSPGQSWPVQRPRSGRDGAALLRSLWGSVDFQMELLGHGLLEADLVKGVCC